MEKSEKITLHMVRKVKQNVAKWLIVDTFPSECVWHFEFGHRKRDCSNFDATFRSYYVNVIVVLSYLNTETEGKLKNRNGRCCFCSILQSQENVELDGIYMMRKPIMNSSNIDISIST